MKLQRYLIALAATGVMSLAVAAQGLVTVQSRHAAKVTADRFEALATQRGLTVFARIDHAAGAAKIGKSLRPTELIIFGNPRAGTPFMECAQTVGIDLPLKALIWEDASARTWISYNDPAYVAARHGADDCPVVENIRDAVASLVAAVVAE